MHITQGCCGTKQPQYLRAYNSTEVSFSLRLQVKCRWVGALLTSSLRSPGWQMILSYRCFHCPLSRGRRHGKSLTGNSSFHPEETDAHHFRLHFTTKARRVTRWLHRGQGRALTMRSDGGPLKLVNYTNSRMCHSHAKGLTSSSYVILDNFQK